MTERTKCPVCNVGFMPEVSPEESAARDALVDGIAAETIHRIMLSIPQDPTDEAPRTTLAQRSDAEEVYDLLVYEIGTMLGNMTVVKLGLKRGEPASGSDATP